MFHPRNLFVERQQFPMGYPHSPGSNIMRAERNAFRGLGSAGCTSCAPPSVLGGLGSIVRAVVAPVRGVGVRGLGALGQVEGEEDSPLPDFSGPKTPYGMLLGVIGIIGTGVGAYHGYKRNRGSIGWAIGWALLGGMFPVIVVPVALAQGVGRPKGR